MKKVFSVNKFEENMKSLGVNNKAINEAKLLKK